MTRKTIVLLTVVASGLAAAAASARTPLASSFTYQGQLKSEGIVLNDTADFTFSLWDAASGGNAIGAAITREDVNVVNGLFTFDLDFGVMAFNGDARWLQVEVRSPSGEGPFTSLEPRQSVTAAPYSLQTRGLRVSDNGSVGIGTTTPSSKLHITDSGPAYLTIEADTDNTIETDNAGIRLSQDGGEVRGRIGYRDGANSMEITNEYNADLTLGTNNTDTMTLKSNGRIGFGTSSPSADFHVLGDTDLYTAMIESPSPLGSWLHLKNTSTGGRHWILVSTGESTNGGPGRLLFYDGTTSATRMAISSSGRVGIGTSEPTDRLSVRGDIGIHAPDGSTPGQLATYGTNGSYNFRVIPNLSTQPNRGSLFLYNEDGLPRAGLGVDTNGNGDMTLATTTDTNIKFRASGDSYLNGGRVGIGTDSPDAPLVVQGVGNGNEQMRIKYGDDPAHYAAIGVDESSNLFIQTHESQVGARGDIILQAGFPTGSWAGGNVGIGTATPTCKLDVVGVTRTHVLEITGGADIAEPFDIGSDDDIPAGSVVAIDPHNPGRLRLSTRAYDTTVAGIVSGAGGVNPGMMLRQENSVADGALPVALTGRVYCLVDADAGGAIQPGDLLTTSNTPGHAMKVSDHARAQGAILGKAMTSLDRGRGLVLVLVSLQ